MVRLKGSSKKEVAGKIYISIPYGAIKSVWLYRGGMLRWEFQFLMVRLKGLSHFLAQTNYERISIPYGAIKSLNNLVD